MTLDTLWKIALFVFGTIFSAGVFVASVRVMRKDLTGVSIRQRADTERIEANHRADAERAHYRFLTILVVVLTYTDKKEDRIQIGKRFLEDGGR